MKKKIIYLILFCFLFIFLSGCSNKDEKEETQKLALPSYMFNEIKKSDQPCTEDETNKIKSGITEWAKAYLLYNNNISEGDKEILDRALYNSIVTDIERKKVKDDREKFYDCQKLTIENVSTTINEALPATYNGKNMGYVNCTVVFNGKRDNKDFERSYSLELLVNYESDIVSIYEIGTISWK